ncbi:MAG: ribbon-helix-helix domain-containing protein [Gammaproteobacteria bacterium]
MANVEKVSIALTAEMAAVVRDAVNSGEYASNSEVVREALRDWRIKRSLRQQGLDELGQLWDKGLASGPGKLGDIESIKAEARRRHRAAQTDTK